MPLDRMMPCCLPPKSSFNQTIILRHVHGKIRLHHTCCRSRLHDGIATLIIARIPSRVVLLIIAFSKRESF